MRRFFGLATVVICAACGEQSVADPCTIRVNVIEIPNVQVNSTRNVDVDLTIRAGTCNDAAKELTWSSTRSDIAEIVSSSNTSATVAGRRAGSSTIIAWLTRTPSVRDSISVNVVSPTDN